MYEIPKIRSRAKAPEETIDGLLLSVLSATMKTLRARDVKPLTFMLQERLAKREDRRLLNIVLNDIRSAVRARGLKASSAKIQRSEGKQPTGQVPENSKVVRDNKTQTLSQRLLAVMSKRGGNQSS
jgi:hypothetical protein